MHNKTYRVSPRARRRRKPEPEGKFQLMELLDPCPPKLRIRGADQANMVDGVIAIHGDTGLWCNVALSPETGLLRIDARAGQRPDLELGQRTTSSTAVRRASRSSSLRR